MNTNINSPKHSNEPITVRQVGNGFLVVPAALGDEHRHRLVSDSEMLVFPSLAALIDHLAKHFSHRAQRAPMDNDPKDL